jgi:putative FmdB family regulatory protein
MPIYEYTCDRCGHAFEALVRAAERAECPQCGSTKLSKMLSVPAAPSHGGQRPPCGLERPLPT